MEIKTVRKLFSLSLVLVSVMGILVCNVYIIGCGGDEIVTPKDISTNFIAAFPPSGAVIVVNTPIILRFDNLPRDLTSNVGNIGPVTASRRSRHVNPDSPEFQLTGPFLPGSLKVTITWADGSQKLRYVVTAVCADENTTCP